MFVTEQKIINQLLKYKFYIVLLLVSLLALYVRLCLFPFQSYDFNTFLNPWYNQISAQGGIRALKSQVGNYGITYQFIISLFTYLPGKSIFWYKALSVFFDYILAITGGLIVINFQNTQKKKKFLFVYSIILFIPTIIMNSGMWAQCDSIYASFLLLSILSLLKNKNKLAFVYLGIAFAFKLQSIFIVPFFLLYYLMNKKFSIFYFFLSLLSFYVCCLPGIIMGRSIFAPFEIYFGQTNETRINLNIPNFSGLLTTSSIMKNISTYEMLRNFLICITLVVLLLVYLFILNNKQLLTNQEMLIIATWTCWTCVMFLPSMHERYMYVADVLLILMACISRKFFVNAVIAVFVSYMTYLFALLDAHISISNLSLLALANYIMFSALIFLDANKLSIKYKI
ncbi:hypothetical protein AALA17_02725 [Lactobacillaceae bacterium 24-114]